MSIELEWSNLDASLSSFLIQAINKQLENTTRPSFIGPVEVTSFDFGSAAPDIELIDLRDIYRDFLEDDEDEDEDDSSGFGRNGPVKVTEGPPMEDEEGFEWVSRRAAGREEMSRSYSFQQHLLPPHVRAAYDGPMSASVPSMPYMGMPLPFGHPWHGTGTPMFRSPTPATPFTPFRTPSGSSPNIPSHQANTERSQSNSNSLGTPPDDASKVPKVESVHPNLQLHFHVNWQSNLRITLTTSLLINYPSPMFMSLPIKLSITGLIFNGELAVAYEGERRRVHVCILDELDPYGPACDRPKRDSVERTNSYNSQPSPDNEDEHPSLGTPPRPSKPLPIGQRLLPSIYIESEIGQTDKHVLKNVTRVERFIQDVIRKTVEEELVFPNFHTLIMGEQ
ncbi:Mitochondrial distribution and morphology protein 12 [Pleurotus ostreatus]|uniref:Mitochondrial distribution and morphology protein 12 n=1 Tax=Pleurotus ostreatus TaxID=5322 RepID=A0A8H7A574_PLEOS|nr:Mitochondrial distribution and morphology protein 12 [Pleurotus ostreatus]KAF7440161.1 Mitochondrial distribution and morphology protein 12 [Pleurotus ostreatus]KAJ8700566.1 Mitochondrial distribution and morphology protein 12 [Pleurotus ostreatus]